MTRTFKSSSALTPISHISCLLQQALEAVTRISKSFPVKMCTELRPELGPLFVGECAFLISLPYF